MWGWLPQESQLRKSSFKTLYTSLDLGIEIQKNSLYQTQYQDCNSESLDTSLAGLLNVSNITNSVGVKFSWLA